MNMVRIFLDALISPTESIRKKIKRYYLFIVPFCLLAAIHLFFYYIFHLFEMDKVWFSDRFQKVEIQIVSGPTVKSQFIGYGPVNYYVGVEYEYQYLGKKYKNSRVSFGAIRPKYFYNSKYENEMKEVVNYIIKNRIGYIDPDEPSYSILIPKNIYEKTHKVRAQWYGMEIAGICTFIGSGIMLYIILCYDYTCWRTGREMNQWPILIQRLIGPFIIFFCVYLLVMR